MCISATSLSTGGVSWPEKSGIRKINTPVARTPPLADLRQFSEWLGRMGSAHHHRPLISPGRLCQPFLQNTLSEDVRFSRQLRFVDCCCGARPGIVFLPVYCGGEGPVWLELPHVIYWGAAGLERKDFSAVRYEGFVWLALC